MAFASLTYSESLRDIKACLGAIGPSYTWALAPLWRVLHWPKPTRTAIGVFLLIGCGVSGCAAPDHLLRSGDRQASEVPDQQFCYASVASMVRLPWG
jgi:hypothetical protein